MLEAEFVNHSLWQRLKRSQEQMDAIDATGNIEMIRAIDPFRELLARSETLRDGEWGMFSESMLSQIGQSWEQIDSYISAYQQTEQLVYLQSAQAQGDALRGQLATTPFPIAHGQAQAKLNRAVNRYREKLDQSRAQIMERLNSALSEASKREVEIEERFERLRGELSTANDSLVAMEERIAQNEIRMDLSLNKQNETFIAGQSTREKEFREWLSNQEKSFEKLAQPHLEAIEAADEVAREDLAVIAALRTSTVDMANIAAGDILADKYGEYAKSERFASYIAYGIGAAAALGSIFIILFAFGFIQSELDWQRVALKFGLTAAAGGVAAVAFRFGGQAVRRSTSFKRQELELRALQPFLKDVDGADLAKTAFLERAFGRAWEDPGARNSDNDVNESVIKLVASVVQNLPKSTN